MPTIEQLNQRHPGVDVERIARHRALYAGGNLFEERLKEFLPKRELESSERYRLRLTEAVYRNYMGPTIGFFSALLFSSKLRVVARRRNEQESAQMPTYYADLQDDADRLGTDMDALAKTGLIDAMVGQFSWFRLHEPMRPDGIEVRTQADESRLGLNRPWVTTLRPEDVLDWETDDVGQLAWAVTHSKTCRRLGLSGGRSEVTETWEHLQRDRVDVYRLRYSSDKPPSPSQEVELVETRAHRFGAVPLVSLDLEDDLWVANRLASPQLGHFRLSNALTWSLTATCYPMLVAKVADPNAFAKGVGAARAFYINPKEDVAWVAPEGAHYEALSREIKAHKDEIFRVAQNMALGVENNAAAIGRSAESKEADAQATRVVMIGFSRVVKEAVERVYELISNARGDQLSWSIEGLDDFAAADIEAFVDVLQKVDDLGDVPSETWQGLKWQRLAESVMPDMSQEQKQQVFAEIIKGVRARAAQLSALPVADEADDDFEDETETETADADSDDAAPNSGRSAA